MASKEDKYPYTRKKLVKHEKNILNVPEIVGRFVVGLVPFVEQLKENNLSSAQIREVIAFIYMWENTKDRTEYFRNFIRRKRPLLYSFIVDNKIKSYTSTGFQFQTFEAIGLAARTILEGREESAPFGTGNALNSNPHTAAREENEGNGGGERDKEDGSQRSRDELLEDPAMSLSARTSLEREEQSEPVGTADALNSNPQTAAWEENEGDGGSERDEDDGSQRSRDELLVDPAISLSARTSLEGEEESAPVGTSDALIKCRTCHEVWHPRQPKVMHEWKTSRTKSIYFQTRDPQTAAWEENEGDRGSERDEEGGIQRIRDELLEDPAISLSARTSLEGGEESAPVGTSDAFIKCRTCHTVWHPSQPKVVHKCKTSKTKSFYSQLGNPKPRLGKEMREMAGASRRKDGSERNRGIQSNDPG